MNTMITNPTESEMEEEKQEKRKGSKKWWIIGGISLVLVLAAGAFIGGMWMVGQATGMGSVMDPEVFAAGLVKLEETPDEPPEMAGAVKSVDDNSIFISTINSTGAFVHGPGASLSEGPTVEVVVDRNTAILADVTAADFDFSGMMSGDGGGTGMPDNEEVAEFANMKRVIEPGVLEDIEPNTMIWIWGERSGDRINATAVLYLVLPFSMGG